MMFSVGDIVDYESQQAVLRAVVVDDAWVEVGQADGIYRIRLTESDPSGALLKGDSLFASTLFLRRVHHLEHLAEAAE